MTKEQHKHWSFCVNTLGMRIYPVAVTNTGNILKIEIEKRDGSKQMGTETYRGEKDVWETIHELYKKYYELNINKTKQET